MKPKHLAVLAAVAALGVPATAVAAKPVDKPAKTEHVQKAKNAVFNGSVVAFDATTVTVHVVKVNHWSKTFKDTDVVFDVSKLKKAPTVATGDTVLVQAKITKDAVAPFVARKLNKLHTEEG